MKLLKPTITFSLFALSLIISIHVNAQLTPQWQTYFGGSGEEYVKDLFVCQNGDLLVCGVTNSSNLLSNTSGVNTNFGGGANDGFIARLNSEGEMLWWTFYGGTKSDYITQVTEDIEGNIWALGETTGNVPTSPNAIKQTQSGLFVTDCFLAKFDSNGNWLEGTLLGGDLIDTPRCMHINENLEIMIAGFTNSNGMGYGDVYDTELNTENAVFIAVLNSVYSVSGFSYFEGNSPMWENNSSSLAFVSNDNSVILYGKSDSNEGIATVDAQFSEPFENGNGFIIKLDFLGFPSWGTYFPNYNAFQSCSKLNDDFFAIHGLTNPDEVLATEGAYQTSVSGQQDGYISLWNNEGELLWTTYFGGPEVSLNRDVITAVAYQNGRIIFSGIADNNYNLSTPGSFQNDISTANTNGIAFLGWFNLQGQLEYCTYVFNPNANTNISNLIVSSSSLYMSNQTSSYYNWVDSPGLNQNLGGSADICLMKWDLPTSIEAFEKQIEVVVYPNPASNQIYFTGLNMARSHVDIIDDNGVLCMSSSSNGSLDISSLSSGVYIAQITTLDKTHHTVKFIKQ